MTARIREFLRKRADDGPCLVVDLDVVRENYLAFAKALPDTKVFYAVKANPAPEVLALLAGLGSSFDTASVAEVEMVLAAGAKPPLSEESQDALNDLSRIAASDLAYDDPDTDEEALEEVTEFVRVAVLLLHSDCVLAPRHRRSLN